MSAAACSRCGKALAQSDVLYTPDAKIVCATCYAANDIVETDKRAANNIKGAAFGSLSAVAISLIFNPFFIMTVLSTSSALYALASLVRTSDERFTKHISPGAKVGMIICAGIALVFNALVAFSFISFVGNSGR